MQRTKLVRERYCEIGREEEKAQHPAGIEPTTSRVFLRRQKVYRCATTVAPKE